MTQPLDADAARLLDAWLAQASGPVEEQPVERLRSSGLINPDVTGPSPHVHDVHDTTVTTPDAPHGVPVRVYRPDDTPSPVVVYAHGGGWTLLSIDAADTLCRHLANGSRCTVVSVGYRLAPEHPFPAAFDDIWAVTRWVASGGLGWSPARVAVGGDSAGGNLAAGVALHARDTGEPLVDLQLLLYPATGLDLDTPSMRTLGRDPRFRLTPASMRWFWSNYLGRRLDPEQMRNDSFGDQRAVPAGAGHFGGLPPAIVVTPQHDPLCDDGRRYAATLRRAGVRVELIEPPDLPHGFAMMLGAVPASRPVLNHVIERLEAAMHDTNTTELPALAAEFLRQPFGTHSADLQSLLHQMRSQPIAGKHFLFISDTNREWCLGRYSTDSPPIPTVDWSIRFNDLESAEWYVFRERWRALFGEELGGPVAATRPATDAAEQQRCERLLRSPAALGYASTRSVRAGASISFHLSNSADTDVDTRIVRLLSPSIGPIGPAFRETTVPTPLNGRHTIERQPIHIGSYARIDGPLPIDRLVTLDLLLHPTIIDDRPRTVATLRSAGDAELVLRIGAVDGLVAQFHMGGRTVATAALPCPTARAWTEVAVSLDLVTGALGLRAHARPATGVLPRADEFTVVDFAEPTVSSFGPCTLTLAAALDPAGNPIEGSHFNGKLERPRVFDRALDPALDSAHRSTVGPVAEWDLSRDIPTSTIRDIGPLALDGVLVNMPTRATRGSMWTGDHLTWMADPSGYAAIHFHEGDLADAGWAPTLQWTVPPDLPSGCYALRIEPSDGSTPEFYAPFFVRPAAGARHADAAFVAPTTTYAAYANMHLRVSAQFNELAHGRLTVLDSTDLLLLRMPQLGASTYDVHRDGSPVVYSSMNRPVTNYRPTGRMYKLCLDLMIVDWLDASGYSVDVVTEDDIDREGVEALAPYRVLLTASHPEYTTRRQLDAIEQFLDDGGRLMYLGGNGFYSAAEVVPGHPDVVEVRRPGQDNLWRVNHAEAASSSSGSPTGLWRNIGRPENALIGVGFITQGFDACTHYARSAASRDARVAWIFEGLDDEAVIGDFGILQGGAAGYEIDRHDITKGSPRHSVVVASSSGHSNLYDLMVPSVLDTLPDPSRTQDPIRADMVFFETGSGGAVFSVGSIAWAGSLTHAGYDNSVSRVTRNVLDRFLDPMPFTPPGPL